MKQEKIVLGAAVLLVALVAPPVMGQSEIIRESPPPPRSDVEYSTAVGHALTPPLRDLDPAPVAPTGFNVEIPIRIVPGGSVVDTGVIPPNLQTMEFPVPGAAPTPAPTLNVLGQTDDENASTVGTRIVPPDTVGDVGATQYLQWINLIFSVYDKATGARVMGPTAGNAFFAGLGFPCATTNNGDPIVLYDQKNDRWVVSQFAINQGIQCVAVSTSSDATGSYNAYAFLVQGRNDYPKLGLWLNGDSDRLAATYRNFPPNPTGGISMDFHIMEYEVMLAGGPAPRQAIVRTGSPFLEGTLPADVEGHKYPTTPAAIFGRYNGAGTRFDVYRFTANFNSPPGMFGLVASIPIGPIDRGVGRVPQPAPGELLDDHSQFTMHRLTYRDRSPFASQMLATTTVDAGGDRAGKHWNEFRFGGDIADGWVTHQDGTYAPGAALERWMGSIAADGDGNIVLGYSASSAGSSPSVRYTSRMPGDPLGTMPGGEVIAQPGGGVQTASNNRWGDYSSLTVDPIDDCTFWFTQEYYANTGGFDFATRIVSLKFPSCGGVTPATPTISLAGGTCPGAVTVSGRGFTPGRDIVLIAAEGLGDFTLRGGLCKGTRFDVGRPAGESVTFVETDGEGGFTARVRTGSGSCFVEALDLSSCRTSEALDASP